MNDCVRCELTALNWLKSYIVSVYTNLRCRIFTLISSAKYSIRSGVWQVILEIEIHALDCVWPTSHPLGEHVESVRRIYLIVIAHSMYLMYSSWFWGYASWFSSVRSAQERQGVEGNGSDGSILSGYGIKKIMERYIVRLHELYVSI